MGNIMQPGTKADIGLAFADFLRSLKDVVFQWFSQNYEFIKSFYKHLIELHHSDIPRICCLSMFAILCSSTLPTFAVIFISLPENERVGKQHFAKVASFVFLLDFLLSFN